MKNQHGGVKKRNSYDLSKSDYELFIEMMNSHGATFRLLTDKCKNGIIFVLNILPENSRYVTLDPETGRFSKLVTSLVVKFVITYSANDAEVRGKYTMKPESFLDEARVQQRIFTDSIVGGRQPLCPGISGFCLFDNKNAKEFLKKLSSFSSVDADAKIMIERLLGIVNMTNQLGIGCIEMENIVGSITLGEFNDECDFDDLTGDEIDIFSTLIAQLTRLYLISKKVHLDLHPGNILIQGHNVYIIDFGLLWETTEVGVVQDPRGSRSFNPENVRKEIVEEFPILSSILYANKELTPDQKENIAKGIMVAIETLDKVHLKKEYPFHFKQHGERGQMTSWLDRIKSNSDIMVAAFDKFNKMHAVEDLKLPRTTLERYSRENRLIDLSLEPRNYYVVVADAERAARAQAARAQAARAEEEEEEEEREAALKREEEKRNKHRTDQESEGRERNVFPWLSPGLGGKRKTKKHKKSKKSKKIKKSRKIRNKYKNKN
jgi:hypothetical protein